MSRSVTPKLELLLVVLLVLVLVGVAVLLLYPPEKRLKPGIDLAGGTSLIYEIDTQGLSASEQQNLSSRVITILRRRIDPANIQNMIWRPHGNTRFEIQMPLASTETRLKREAYKEALAALMEKNKPSVPQIMRALLLPSQDRSTQFSEWAHGDPNRLAILDDLASAYDRRNELQQQRDRLRDKLSELEQSLAAAGLDAEQVRANRGDWAKLTGEPLAEALKEFLDGDQNIPMLTEYVDTYRGRSTVLRELLTDPNSATVRYDRAKGELDGLNLSTERLNLVLEMPVKSVRRANDIEQLKEDFRDRADLIDRVVAAYNEYRPYKGRLDDPADVRRMLKGAGILEWRILPTSDRADLTPGEIDTYVKNLTEQGPKAASDNDYVWCEMEDIKTWKQQDAILGRFADKDYVLASSRVDEALLHRPGWPEWKLQRAGPGTDRMGRRAISFVLDDKGGNLFGRMTGKNMGRPLCILLDDQAISAPTISDRIYRQGIITGTFTQTDVDDMVNKLNAGSLPARLIEQPISVKTIGPSIGEENRDKGIRAGIIGLAVVMLCMLAYYLKAGAVADVALAMNILFVLACMALIRATFTLPGIAGVILTIGMSVDANVLIFERIREEQAKGSGLSVAIRNGYQRALRAILDANVTTFITAWILYIVASEEIKGFALVLMIGIVLSLLSALLLTRLIFDMLVANGFVRNKLVMLRLFREPKVNWLGLRPVFFALSILLIAAGLFVFVTRDDTKNNKYDIEFTGGTVAQVNFKAGISLTRQEVEDRIHAVAAELGNPALAAANVYSIGDSGSQYEINTTETNKTVATITPSDPSQTVESMTAAIQKAQRNLGSTLANLGVTRQGSSFVVSTSQINPSLVRSVLAEADPNATILEPKIDPVVNNAILKAFPDELEIQRNLEPTITSEQGITSELVDSFPELADFVGGLKLECGLARAATVREIDQRLKDLIWYDYMLVGANLEAIEPNRPVRSFVYVSAHPEAGLRELRPDEWTRFAENEKARLLLAAERETSLPRVTQVDPSVGSEQRNDAIKAIIWSLLAIIGYVWVRFGDVRYGLAAIAALVHDVCITLGVVTACTYIASTAIGQKLLIGDFKINLAMIAAFLTLIGYSLNDTIVVFDRIRENRRKAQLTARTISNSINQTISRTILTSFTTFVVVLIMYIFGGQGLRGFTFAIGLGVIVGTYSSIAIAAPLLLIGAKVQETTGRAKKKAKYSKSEARNPKS